MLRYNHRWDADKRPKALKRLAPYAGKFERLTADELLRRDLAGP